MVVKLIDKTGIAKDFSLEQAQKILCYQLRKNITGDRAWKLEEGFKYEIVEGESCCGGKGKLVISKVTVSKKTKAKE